MSKKKVTPIRWTGRPVTIHTGLFGDKTDDRFKSVLGYATRRAPGLAVTPGIGSYEGQWAVTHTASGFKIRGHQPTIEAAKGQLLAIAGIADWTQPAGLLAALRGLGNRVDKALAPPKRKRVRKYRRAAVSDQRGSAE